MHDARIARRKELAERRGGEHIGFGPARPDEAGQGQPAGTQGAEGFARQRSVTYPLAYDEGGLLYGRISLRVLAPTTAFVRADGTLAGIHIGQLDAAELRGLIARYLGIQVPA